MTNYLEAFSYLTFDCLEKINQTNVFFEKLKAEVSNCIGAGDWRGARAIMDVIVIFIKQNSGDNLLTWIEDQRARIPPTLGETEYNGVTLSSGEAAALRDIEVRCWICGKLEKPAPLPAITESARERIGFMHAGSHVTGLFLWGVRLYALPESFQNLVYLKELDLFGTNLLELPAWIGIFTRLRHLQVGGNKLRTLPSSIGKLHALEYFNTGNNRLNSLPREISDLVNLKELEIYNNANVDSLTDNEKGVRVEKGVLEALESRGCKIKRHGIDIREY